MPPKDELAHAAAFGARMAAKGLTPDQVTKLMDVARPALDEAQQWVQAGGNPAAVRFEVRPNEQ
ncbi:hypothetical protein L6E12_27060 [Actinokineospora sp. PR83]|uniref:hypothetical protein n=1 Tax=Actinokineospora sp. PR83 TaxID=2884908 RepID=UPI001F200B9E|nr:hypothetical protein [Actinokineospora sp. PR83]MCG8919441.1 hypothetical protein [Actinokineospora sp. PR83]